MARIIGLVCGWLIASSVGAPPLRGQELLKQLENRLKQAAGKQQETIPSEPGEAQRTAPQDTAPQSESLEALSEELPMPGNDSASTGAEPQLPKVKPRSGPTVVPPRQPRQPSRPVPVAPIEPDADADGYLGLTLEPLAGGNFGLAVVEVMPQSPAWKSGFRVGDRVIGVGGQAVTTIDQFALALKGYAPGEAIKFLVQRQGRSVNLTSILQGRGLAQRIQGDLQGNRSRRPISPYQPISGPTTSEGGVVLGISVSNLSEAFRQQFNLPVYRGASISEVVVGSPAERAGLRPGDCIVEIDGQIIHFADEVVEATRASIPGQTILIGFYRGVQKMRTEVPVVAERNMFPDAWHSEGENDALSPEYVSALQAEIARLNEELEAMRLRVQDLESRLPPSRR
jgi:membrane-associated protease RseP (regulator of RpoE activity)